ncbi:MAG: hypothetical protein HQK58_11560, partial [Deltaproteobacteria bacterium]|nr:hypothetical protein [Deltaproteobacteria bacterium]
RAHIVRDGDTLVSLMKADASLPAGMRYQDYLKDFHKLNPVREGTTNFMSGEMIFLPEYVKKDDGPATAKDLSPVPSKKMEETASPAAPPTKASGETTTAAVSVPSGPAPMAQPTAPTRTETRTEERTTAAGSAPSRPAPVAQPVAPPRPEGEKRAGRINP